MSRSLVRIRPLAAALVVVLASCASQEPVEVAGAQPPAKAALPPVQKWLRWQDTISTMSASQLATALEATAKPGNANQLFYSGLLNQQSDTYNRWVMARDIFRQLQQDEALTPAQKQLAGLLERYNQSRINWFHSRDELRVKYEDLQLQVDDLQAQNSLLEQKIKAITELEATISTRKEE